MSKTVRRVRKKAASESAPSKPPKELTTVVDAARDKKAIDPVVLDLRGGVAFTDFFLIFTGANARQVQAIADAIEEALRAKGLKPALVEGHSRAQWILLDYFDFVVHVFSAQTREFYGLERLWGDAKKIEV